MALRTRSVASPQRTVLVCICVVMVLTLATSPSMEAACSSVPWERAWAPVDTRPALESTCRATWEMSRITLVRLARMDFRLSDRARKSPM